MRSTAVRSSAQYSKLVGLIYDFAAEPSMSADLLAALNDWLGGHCAHFFTRHNTSGAVLASHMSKGNPSFPVANQQYVCRWGASDPRIKRLAMLPEGEVFRCHDHFDDAFIAGSDFYQYFFMPQGFRWSMGAMISSGPATTTVVTGLRFADAPPFDDAAAAALRQLLPHFRRAAAIGTRLERQAAAIESAAQMLRDLPTPCLYTDEAGRCIEGNVAFQHAGERLALRVVTGRVRFLDPDLQGRWEAALWETHATGVGRTLQFTGLAGRQWTLHVSPGDPPTANANGSDQKLILVVFEEKATDLQPHPDLAASQSRLTRAELDVLAAMLKGMPAKAIADRRGASVNTVRNQIMTILGKTGFNSQRELLASFGASSFGDSAFAQSSSSHSANER